MATSKGRGSFAENLRNTAFAQQRISAWQPVLAPRWISLTVAILGIVFITLGITLIHASNRVVECTIQYPDPTPSCLTSGDCIWSSHISAEDCRGSSFVTDPDTGSSAILKPVFLYYGLTRFYQNHRRYMLSRSLAQLQGEIIVDSNRLSDCQPALFSKDGYRILTPCGLAARSVFNDTIWLSNYNLSKDYVLQEAAKDIVWPPDTITHFRNPPDDKNNPALNKIEQWLDPAIFPGKMENAHFMVWMRDAALPNFRKLYARIDQDIVLPLTVSLVNRYPVAGFGGRKSVVLSTTTWLGGKNPFLGILACTLGGLFFCVGLFMATKNRRNPRILGDVRFLKWNRGRANNH